MKTRIYIATPSGPVQVERIWREEGIAESVVCLKRTTEIIPISADYDAFVKRPSGIIEREFGPFEAGAFRLELSAGINQGKSWQLAVFAAHALVRDGLLAGPDDPFDRAIWLTGQVDNDLKVGGVTQVPEKIHAALGELTALAKAGKQVLLYVPQENTQALTGANLPPEIEAHAVVSAAYLLDAIGTADSHRTATAAPESAGLKRTTAPPADRHRHKRAVLGFVFLVLGAAAVAAGVILPGELTPDKPAAPAAADVQETSAVPEAPSAATEQAVPKAEPAPSTEPSPTADATRPEIAIFEVHPSAGGGCPAVHFGADDGVAANLEPASARDFTSRAANNLCAIEFRLTPAPDEPYIALAIEVISGRYVEVEPMPATLRGSQPLSGPHNWRINLPLRMDGPLEYYVHALSAETAITPEVYKLLQAGDVTVAGRSGMSQASAHHTVSR